MAKQVPQSDPLTTVLKPDANTHNQDNENTGSDGYNQGASAPHKAKGSTGKVAPNAKGRESYDRQESRLRLIPSTTPEAGALGRVRGDPDGNENWSYGNQEIPGQDGAT